jgi:hypothetical protein
MTDLDELGKRITRAKFQVFRAQDIAAQEDDPVLRRRLHEARQWLEAADRRVDELEIRRLEAAR